MTLTLITAPPAAPISRDQVKAQLRLDGTADDTLVDGLIAAVVSHLDGPDGILGRCLAQQTWDATFDGWPARSWRNRFGSLWLPLAPTISVDSVKYIDNAGVLQTLSSSLYTVDLGGKWPAKVTLNYGQVWPTLYLMPDAVTVRFTAGYAPGSGSPTDYGENLPAALRQAMLLLCAHWFENRVPVNIGNITTELPFSVKALLAPLMVRNFY